MCFQVGEFLLGDNDHQVGDTQLILDVVPGRGGMFSLENPEGVRFLIRSRVFDPQELKELREAGLI